LVIERSGAEMNQRLNEAKRDMKTPLHFFTGAILVAVAVLGCVTPRPAPPEAARTETDDLKARIDAAVSDRNNWVFPKAQSYRRIMLGE
jgi:hypothetical protein